MQAGGKTGVCMPAWDGQAAQLAVGHALLARPHCIRAAAKHQAACNMVHAMDPPAHHDT